MKSMIVLTIIITSIFLGTIIVRGEEIPVTKESSVTKNVYTLSWNDEFDGTSLNLNKWYNRGDPYLPVVQNGNLNCKLNVVNNIVKRCYINSKYQFKYGFVEMRAKPSPKYGVDNQFWLTPAGWIFEIDMMEYVPRKQQLSMNAMYRDSSGVQHWIGHNEYGNLATGYHLYQFEWTPYKYVWYIDGIEKFRTTDPKFIANVDVKIELAMCGAYGYKGCPVQGIPDQITDLSGLPTDFIIDYVRVYKQDAIYGVTTLYPNGGEKWIRGKTYTTNWASTGNIGTYVKVELLKGGALNKVISSGTPNDGSYSWAVPLDQPLGTDYKVRITSTNNPAYSDASNSNFVISNPITVTSPNGLESWTRGTTKTIKWGYTGNPGAYVKIELLKNGILNRIISYSTPIGSSGLGYYNWAIPSTQTLGSDYKIRVTSTSNSAYTDISNNNFIISGSATSSITVVSPNGWENWNRGTTHAITWSKTGSTGSYVKIELLKGGIVNKVINSYTPNDGYYSWYISPYQTIGSDYKIRITSTSNSIYKDMSNNYFKIY